VKLALNFEARTKKRVADSAGKIIIQIRRFKISLYQTGSKLLLTDISDGDVQM
jgi:DNA integrity scanning protein DisA with diadenylate cyclase activity